MVVQSSSENSLRLCRTINAPREKVFAAWTQEQHLMNWWRVDDSMQTVSAEIDLRVGGKYRLGMHSTEHDKTHFCSGEFLVVEPPEKLVYTWNWEPPGMDVAGSQVTVEFKQQGDQTELVLTHENFPNAEATSEHSHGWTGCLEQLAALAETI